MFEKFPKKRIQLPADYVAIYNQHIRNNRNGGTTATSLSIRMEQWMHKKTAADLRNQNTSTLEIGAGTLNQLNFENSFPYDIVEPMSELYEKSPQLNKIRKVYTDISEIPVSVQYDRITSIATFEHIANLPEVVAKTCIILKKDGTLRVAIPNEGTILWYLGTTLFTGIEFKLKYKLRYSLLMKFEHVNNANEIEEILQFFYKSVTCSVFGISKSFAFYRFYECSQPHVEIAHSYIK